MSDPIKLTKTGLEIATSGAMVSVEIVKALTDILATLEELGLLNKMLAAGEQNIEKLEFSEDEKINAKAIEKLEKELQKYKTSFLPTRLFWFRAIKIAFITPALNRVQVPF